MALCWGRARDALAQVHASTHAIAAARVKVCVLKPVVTKRAFRCKHVRAHAVAARSLDMALCWWRARDTCAVVNANTSTGSVTSVIIGCLNAVITRGALLLWQRGLALPINAFGLLVALRRCLADNVCAQRGGLDKVNGFLQRGAGQVRVDAGQLLESPRRLGRGNLLCGQAEDAAAV